jgi:PAS domain S-box-containing protein
MSDPLRLFVIEDDDDVALVIRKTLERARYHVLRCRTAADALIVLGQTSFDLVLLDQALPDMTGVDLLERLAAEGIFAPVLMVTARGDEHVATRVLQAGALDYVVKDSKLDFLHDLPKRVTESVRRHRLEQLNRLLVQSLESARDGILITDLQGVIVEVNHALEAQTGFSRLELLGQTPRVFKSGVHAPEFYRHMWQTILNRQSWQGELTNRRKDGVLRQTSMTISPIVDNQGRLTHFVGIQRDITEHKQLERQLLQAQKMQSVGTLAGGVAHEFNNLLAGINGYASLGLREPGAPAVLREFFANIVDLSERAAGLTRQLLAFARKPALIRQPIALCEVLRGTVELVRRSLHQELRLELPTNDEPVLVVEADANQLQQALVNLGLNARDALLANPPPVPAGEPGLTFRLRHEVVTEPRAAFPQAVPPGDYAVIDVDDRGGGMSPDVLTQALDPFFTTKEVGQGTGLGLPMVFGIVQGHHGYLTLESEPGVGTLARIYLPRLADVSADRPASPVSSDPAYLEPEPAAGRSIVVIDDEDAVLDVVRRFLQIAGHQVTCHASGESYLKAMATEAVPDLVILDLMMPREDPLTTFARIRETAPVPVLLCTGRAEADPAPHLLRQPNTWMIRKPFRMNELWYAVRRALSAGG